MSRAFGRVVTTCPSFALRSNERSRTRKGDALDQIDLLKLTIFDLVSPCSSRRLGIEGGETRSQ
jgi:hypothetical protein